MANSNYFILCSDDPLLKNDKSDELIHKAMSSHQAPEFLLFTYSDFQSTSQTNLTKLENELMDNGFFCDFKVIKIYLKDLDKTAVDVLNCITEHIRDNLLVIVDMPRIATTYTKALASDLAKAKKRGKALTDADKKRAFAHANFKGAQVLSFYPPEGAQMLSWISNRSNMYGFSINRDAAEFLALSCEGNLVTIDQTLKIMQLSTDLKVIDRNVVQYFFTKDARFTGFEFPEAILNADSMRALNILDSLLNEQAGAKTQVLGLMLSRLDSTLNTVLKCRSEKIFTQSFDVQKAFFFKENIKIPSIQKTIINASRNMPLELIDYLLKELTEASIKFSLFDLKSVTQALQRISICMSNFKAMQLCQN